jgi:hypothetical protein
MACLEFVFASFRFVFATFRIFLSEAKKGHPTTCPVGSSDFRTLQYFK